MFYLTFNDPPSGIYSSQVIDVVKFLRSELHIGIRLVAFISLRDFFLNRKKIKAELQDAIVVPMFPGVSRWKLNTITLKLLCLRYFPKAIIGRSVLATHLAFKSGVKKIVYDGRGAITAEWKEYGVITDPGMLSEINELEKEAVLKADHRIAVSEHLVKWWQKEYAYTGTRHVVIPCTLNEVFIQLDTSEQHIFNERKKLGFNASDKVIMYSGSLAGWQSFDLVYNFIKPLLTSDPHIKLFFLSEKDPNILRLEEEFPGRIGCKKVRPKEVPSYLLAGDFSLLIREQSITNQVASPVKFAEYLACGLPVIISENLGDYTGFVLKNNCGHLLNSFTALNTGNINKSGIRKLALENFTKSNFRTEYKKVLESI